MTRAAKLIEQVNVLNEELKMEGIEEKLKPQDFADEMEADEFLKFAAKYKQHKLEKQVDKLPNGNFMLNKKMQKELAKTYNIFADEKEAWKRADEVEKMLKKQAEDAVKKAAKKLGLKDTKGLSIDVSIDLDHQIRHSADRVTLEWNDEELEMDGGVFFGNDDDGAVAHDAASSWDWAAWLIDFDDSPLGQESFYDAYMIDHRSQVLSELSDLDGQGDLDSKVTSFLKKAAELD